LDKLITHDTRIFVPMDGDGERLRAFFDSRGLKYLVAAERLGVHVNTLRNWMAQDVFKPEMLDKLVATFPTSYTTFPNAQLLEPSIASQGAWPVAATDTHHTDKRYVDLLNRYNLLLEKHVALQERLLEQE
jgi:hypothetical protein